MSQEIGLIEKAGQEEKPMELDEAMGVLCREGFVPVLNYSIGGTEAEENLIVKAGDVVAEKLAEIVFPVEGEIEEGDWRGKVGEIRGFLDEADRRDGEAGKEKWSSRWFYVLYRFLKVCQPVSEDQSLREMVEVDGEKRQVGQEAREFVGKAYEFMKKEAGEEGEKVVGKSSVPDMVNELAGMARVQGSLFTAGQVNELVGAANPLFRDVKVMGGVGEKFQA